jgi:Uma2 family endonuclease
MTASLLSADEYIATAATRPRWTELVDGEVIVNNPTIRHQDVVTHIQVELVLWIRGASGRGRSPGQIDVKLDDRTVLAPDVLWAAEGRIPDDGTHLDGPPDLAVEVRSASTWRYDVGVKLRRYESAGVAEVWLVDTASNSVIVHRRSASSVDSFDVALEIGAGGTLTTPLLPDFALDITELFNR